MVGSVRMEAGRYCGKLSSRCAHRVKWWCSSDPSPSGLTYASMMLADQRVSPQA